MSAQPLTDAEFERLAEVLQRCGGKHAMNIEMGPRSPIRMTSNII